MIIWPVQLCKPVPKDTVWLQLKVMNVTTTGTKSFNKDKSASNSNFNDVGENITQVFQATCA